MSEHYCPLCARGKLKRSERTGFMEMNIYPLLGKFPWRCSTCRYRGLLRDRGEARLYVDRATRASRRQRPSSS